MSPRHRTSNPRRRRATAVVTIGMLAMALTPAACNVFVSLARCSQNDDCPAPYTCDMTGRFCVARLPADADADTDTATDADAATDAHADAEAGAAPDADAAPAPPPCDVTAPFGAPTPVLGLDPTATSARFSDDELTIMYSASPACSAESCADLFFAHRPSLDAGFGAGDSLPGPNISVPNASEYWPTITKDGLILYFESTRALTTLPDGGYFEDQSRIWTATRSNKGVDFSPPYLLQAFQNIPGPESNPYIHPNGRSLYFVSAGRGGEGLLDIFVASLDPDFGFQAMSVTNIRPVNSGNDDSAPVVTLDERKLYFARDDKNGLRQIYRSTRGDTASDFGAPELVRELNSPLATVEDYPSAVSLDECRFYFVSDRPLASETGDAATPPGSYRLWVATRPK